jgi:transcriptional regulator NrdR family protein
MTTRTVIDPLCEKCSGYTWVVGTGFDEVTHQIVRRRKCRDCSHRFYTVQQEEAYLSPSQRVEYVARGQRLVRVVEEVAA